MGYTHYWSIDFTKIDQAQYDIACRQIARLAKRYQRANPKGSTGRLSGYTAHSPIGKYDGIELNGSGDMSHESFNLPSFDISEEKNAVQDFCKTARKPYDIAVVGALILLKHYLGDAVSVNSDGDFSDWYVGHLLARQLVPTVKMPETIKATPRRLRMVI